MVKLKIFAGILSCAAVPLHPVSAQTGSTSETQLTQASPTAPPGETTLLQDGTELRGAKHFTVLFEVAKNPGARDVILIPGLATPRAVWDATRMQLKGKYRLHIVQVRGFGDNAGANSEGPVIDPFVEELADYIGKTVMKNKNDQKPLIIGHSFGGLSAMKLAAAHPDRVERAMVVDSLPFFGVFYGPGATAENIAPQADAIRKAIQTAPAQRLDDRSLQTMSGTEAGREQVAKWGLTADPKVTGQVFYEVMTADIRPLLPHITVPVTMLYPIEENGAFPAGTIETIYKSSYADAPSVTVKRINDSRHFIMLDQPDIFANSVTEFLDKK